MPRGDKSKYTEKQKRQAEHIEEGYEQRGVPEEEAERRAWATVNKMTGGGKNGRSGRGHKIKKAPAKKGGREGVDPRKKGGPDPHGQGGSGGGTFSAPVTPEPLQQGRAYGAKAWSTMPY